ncbi:MAG: MerC domain-containing protein [Algibacter sp.]|uniref:MerC domain-containing protein n=1 Tax=Algibacter sp. TaxID=1872428 RepID=UPI00329A0AA8
MILIKKKSDILGTLSSTLCLVHCVATPFIFLAQASSTTCCDTPPNWWKLMDYVFLSISFLAIYWSTKTTSIKWIKPVLWINWVILAGIILNEKVEALHLPEALIYIPSIALVALHLYNRKYCHCNTNKCCVNEQ